MTGEEVKLHKEGKMALVWQEIIT